MQIPQYCLSGNGLITHLYPQIGIHRDIDVQPGAESNQAVATPPHCLVSLLQITDNASGDQPGNLYDGDPGPARIFQQKAGAFIFKGCTLIPHIQKSAAVIEGIDDPAGDGGTVYMDIEYRHENTD